MTASRRLVLAVSAVLVAAPAFAQNCPCPPAPTPGWHGSAGAGVALTSGNSDTQTYNLSLSLVYDPQKQYLVKIDGLYLKAKAQGEDTADKAGLGVRGERKLDGGFLFADARYERDRFKLLDYLISPNVGFGYKFVNQPRLVVSADAGVGLAFEKLETTGTSTSGALRAGQSLTWKISDNSTLIELTRALWKMNDFADAFYHFEAGLASSINQRLELKLGALVDVKNKPASPILEKTDKILLASIVFKF
jgi:putative salt-induced outer membrane protein YdiY